MKTDSPFLSQIFLDKNSSKCPGKSKYRRVPILTELKNPYSIHFIEQLSGMEDHLSGTSLHLSTAFSTGTVFSGSFLDSLLATAFHSYHVLELLQMLVTGGISSQLKQHLDKDFFGLTESCTSVLAGRMQCKLGLLSLNQMILSDIQRTSADPPSQGSSKPLSPTCLNRYCQKEQAHARHLNSSHQNSRSNKNGQHQATAHPPEPRERPRVRKAGIGIRCHKLIMKRSATRNPKGEYARFVITWPDIIKREEKLVHIYEKIKKPN
ncbi:Potassium channel subfamily U member 1 [Manis javanica]|nr:Potassium channel subfamily U member 1 [Manis javanica]